MNKILDSLDRTVVNYTKAEIETGETIVDVGGSTGALLAVDTVDTVDSWVVRAERRSCP